MSFQTPSNPRYRYCIQGIEVKSTKQIKNKVWGRLLVDGEVVHNLSPIKKNQPLAWNGSLYCDLGQDSVISFQLYAETYFGLKPVLKCSIEFSMLDISNEVPAYSVECASGAQSFSFTFLNPPTVLYSATIRAALKTISNFGTTMSEFCPTVAGTALASCHTVSEMLEGEIEYTKDLEDLAVGFADALRPIHTVHLDVYSTDMKDTTAGILDLVQKATRLMIDCMLMTETECRDRVSVQESRCAIQDLLDQLRRLRTDFDQQREEKAYHDRKLLAEKAYYDRINKSLNSLKPVAHSTHHDYPECLLGTRTTTIGDIDEWIEQGTGASGLLWIHGPSGIGKSAIAASVCRSLETRKMLCASFFCKWNDPELCEPKSVIRSIIYNLAKHHMEYMTLVDSVVHDNLDLSSLLLQMLAGRLVTMPLTAMNDETTREPTYVVVDALNQCGTNAACQEVLCFLLSLSQLAPWLKIIVTAYPDPNLLRFIDRISESSLKRIDVHKYDALDNISTFIRARLSQNSGSYQPDDLCISSLTEKSGSLFIWADIACRYILDGPDPRGRLEDVCSLSSSPIADVSLQLDPLYALVVKDVFLNSMENHALRKWLGVIVVTCPRIPLSIGMLEQLLADQLHLNALGELLSSLHPLLYEDHSKNRRGVIRVHHHSFIDYITTQSRSKELYIDLVEIDPMLSTCCLRTMLNELRFNICGLETSYMFNRDVPDLESRVRSAISPHVSYSCLWWIDHLAKTDPIHADTTVLKEFLFGRALFYWIEALGLMKKLDIAVSQLSVLIEWTHRNPDLAELSECAYDAYRFIFNFYGAISASTPHLYLSAVAFAPTLSAIAQRGREWFPNAPKFIRGEPQIWSPCLQILSHSSSILCIAPSPNCRAIAMGSQDHTVQVWDAQSNVQAFAPLVGHSAWVWSVAFSPDNRYIASASQDKTVQLWDAHTGGRLYAPFDGHSGPVLCVAFSHDSRFVISGSHDKTLRMWDSDTGVMVSEPLVGHSGPVMAVAFSPDGYRIASGSFDKSVRVWDTKTSSSVQFTGHSGWVRAVAFSPDGRRIISGSSDKTIRIWGNEPNSRVYAPIVGHPGMVNCVAFSPDSRYIISGSSDTTVRVWDPETGAQLFAPLVGHSDHVLSVAFSCDGGRIISCSSDHTVRIWDLQLNKTGKFSGELAPFFRFDMSLRGSPEIEVGCPDISGGTDGTII